VSDVHTAFISGWATHHPDAVLPNDELVARLDTSHEWLDERLGIRERRVVDGESVAELCRTSAAAALARAGIAGDRLDLIVGSSAFDDMEMPALAARVGADLAPGAHAFDVRAACSGWVIGLDTAVAYLATGRATYALVTAGESTARHIDRDDRATAVFFGDASVSAVVQRTRPRRGLEVLGFERLAANDLHHLVEVPVGGTFRTDASATRDWVEAAMVEVARRLLDRHGAGVEDLRACAFHQANLRLVERVGDALGLDRDRNRTNVAWAGNTASAAGPSALFEGLDADADDLRDGDLAAIVTVGSGLNAIAVLLRHVDAGA